MKKIKVLRAFFDKKEDKYVYPDKEPTIEREKSRAEELIKAGACAELDEESQDTAQKDTTEEQVTGDESQTQGEEADEVPKGEPKEATPEEKPKTKGKKTK